MIGTTPFEPKRTIGGREVSLPDIYSAADIDLVVTNGNSNLPRQDKVRLADLHALMTSASTASAQPGEYKVQMLIVTEDADDPDTLGIMFDFGDNDANDIPREGFAVFESAHMGLPAGVIPEVMLTSAHEFAHVFNLHHTDWEGTAFDHGSSIEGYSLTDTVLWKLSDASIAHMKGPSCPVAFVMPGAGSAPFGYITQAHADKHKSTPHESYSVVPASMTTFSRKAGPVKGAVARTTGGQDVTATSPLRLEIAAPKNEYTVGEAVSVTVALKNTGTAPRDAIRLIDPEYRFLSITVKGPGDAEPHPYVPPVLRDARKPAKVSLAPQDSIVTDAKIFFGADGWMFSNPGEYVVQATYPVEGEPGSYVQSSTLQLTVKEPPSNSQASRARGLLLRQDGQRLGSEQGLFLYMGGGSHLAIAEKNIKAIVDTAPDSQQATDARLALANEALAPTVDPTMRSKPRARLSEAMNYLERAQADLNKTKSAASTSLLRTQAKLIEELKKANRNGDAQKQRAIVEDSLSKPDPVRALDRRAVERSL